MRWITTPNPLPPTWTPESKIRFTATIIDKPEYTDSKTIIQRGVWNIQMRGYAVIMPGSTVSFVGTVEPKLLGGKVTKIAMVDPTFDILSHSRSVGALHSGSVLIVLGELREKWVSILEKTLPEPMSSLAAGILLGVKGQMPGSFYQSLVSTGTLHIIAASGFNVSIVAEVLMMVLGRIMRRSWTIGVGIFGIVFYVLLAGASASVVRAGIMASLTLVSYYFGRPTEARRLLWVTAGLMLLVNPLLILDIGFQLSFVATGGILYIEPWIELLHSRSVGALHSGSVSLFKFLKDYLYPTLAASIATLPIILWHFGRVSWISPLVNMLVLPLVPLIMLITALVVGVGMISSGLAYVVAWFLYPLLAYMIWVINFFGGI